MGGVEWSGWSGVECRSCHRVVQLPTRCIDLRRTMTVLRFSLVNVVTYSALPPPPPRLAGELPGRKGVSIPFFTGCWPAALTPPLGGFAPGGTGLPPLRTPPPLLPLVESYLTFWSRSSCIIPIRQNFLRTFIEICEKDERN